MSVHLTMEQRQLARRLHAKGLSLREVGWCDALAGRSTWICTARGERTARGDGLRTDDEPPCPYGSSGTISHIAR